MAFVGMVVGVGLAFLGVLVVGSVVSMLTSSGPTALALGLLAGLSLCLLLPFLVDRKLTRSFRRLQPGAKNTFFQALAIVNGVCLAVPLLLTPRFARTALEQRGETFVPGHSALVQSFIDRAAARIPRSEGAARSA